MSSIMNSPGDLRPFTNRNMNPPHNVGQHITYATLWPEMKGEIPMYKLDR